MKAICIIPARGGSKRIPRKNIRPFAGQPMISHSIQTALASNCFSKVMVSTDDEEIAQIAKQYGAEVPFFRSAANSTDHAMTAEVLIEVVEQYKTRNEEFALTCCFYPTAPFTTPARLAEGYQMLCEQHLDAVVPVCKFSYPIQRCLRIAQGELSMFWPENYNVRSQDLEPAYHDSGSFYWIQTKELLSQKRLFAQHTGAIILPESEVQDIDTEEDWKMAEFKFEYRKKSSIK